jgi:F0F1-type ATP synthase membrane subunit c/vacuolar-type H+-ATPase subunit K
MPQFDPAQARRTNQILWLTLLASQVVYVVVILSGAARTRDEPLDLPVFPLALAVVSVATAIGSHFSWRRATGAGRPIHAAAPDPGTRFTFYILAWVLDESIAIYGLVLGLLAFSVAAWGPFSLAAFTLMLVHRPS